jgi:hypothetical protein
MATNLAINEQLLNTALAVGGERTKKDTVNSALKEFIARRQAKDISKLFGSVEYSEDYDYKALREQQ